MHCRLLKCFNWICFYFWKFILCAVKCLNIVYFCVFSGNLNGYNNVLINGRELMSYRYSERTDGILCEKGNYFIQKTVQNTN